MFSCVTENMKTEVVNAIYGAIYGDIIGSTREGRESKPIDFRDCDVSILEQKGHFTDDTVLTIATLDALMNDRLFFETYKNWGNRYYNVGYGSNFREKILTGLVQEKESHSSANGCLMRASPLLSLEDPEDGRIKECIQSTHNHPDSLFAFKAYREFAVNGEILLPNVWPYDELKPVHCFDMSAIGTLRDAISIYEKSNGTVEFCAFLAACIGGDTDTIGAIACSIAGYKNGVSYHVKEVVRKKITGEMLDILALVD